MSSINLGLGSFTAGSGLAFSPATTLNVTVANSITIAGSGTGAVQLVNDSASPGNSKFYGTNGAGTRGWYAIASAEVSAITGTAGQVLANGNSGTSEVGVVTLTLAAALVSINSITSASSTDLTLTGSGGASLTLGTNGIARYGTTVTTSAASGDFILPNNNALRFVNAAGSATFKGIRLTSGNIWNFDDDSLGANFNGNVSVSNVASILKVFGTTVSTSTTTGAFQVAGGAGIGGAAYIGGTLNLASGITFAAGQPTITTSATDSIMRPIFVPSGTGTQSGLIAYGGSSTGTSEWGGFTYTGSTGLEMRSSSNGGATKRPLLFYPGDTLALTLATTGAATFAGNLTVSGGLGLGVTSIATAAGTTTLTSASTAVQVFTGSAIQTVVLPAANVFGAGVAVHFVFKNRSSGVVTVTRAGSDTIDGNTFVLLNLNDSVSLLSDGVSAWEIV